MPSSRTPTRRRTTKLVDRLLASPHYGERMALPWLDAARYADCNGFQQDGDTWQWMWRDWVVQALNADMPFDRFSIEQLAGDLLPEATNEQKIASGFNREPSAERRGAADCRGAAVQHPLRPGRSRRARPGWASRWPAEYHDHKYDPMTRTDYYGLLDAFNRVPESAVPNDLSARIRIAPPVLELPTAENTHRLAELEGGDEGDRSRVETGARGRL